MRDQGLLSIEFDATTKAVTLVYEPDAPYALEEIIAYVEDMTEKKSPNIMIYESDTLMHNLRLSTSSEWIDVKE